MIDKISPNKLLTIPLTHEDANDEHADQANDAHDLVRLDGLDHFDHHRLLGRRFLLCSLFAIC